MFSVLMSMLLSNSALADNFSGNYQLHQPGITYQIQLKETKEGQIKGVLNSTLIDLPILGSFDGEIASGDLLGLGNLGFEAKIEDDILRFEILQKDENGNMVSNSGKKILLSRMNDPLEIEVLTQKAKKAEQVILEKELNDRKEQEEQSQWEEQQPDNSENNDMAPIQSPPQSTAPTEKM